MSFIFYLSSIPLGLPEVVHRLDPERFVLHLAEYALLGFLLFNARQRLGFALLVGTAYGLSDELHQLFVPTRVFSPHDVLADSLGSLLGAYVCSRLKAEQFS